MVCLKGPIVYIATNILHTQRWTHHSFEGPQAIGSQLISPLHDDKLDMAKMRERAAHWIPMYENPFSILGEEGFLMLKEAHPEWKKISCQSEKMDCMQVYGIEKKKLKGTLRNASIIIDLRRSKPQKIEYVVVTAHWVDIKWKLQKHVLSCIHLPPPQRGICIATAILMSLREWINLINIRANTINLAYRNNDTLYELYAEYASTICSCMEDVGESESRSRVENDTIDPMSSLMK
ncbi:LOW QUALITY PROTEIN: hypothetical protein Cgig2_007860 [Carnegiea gigantea]|uniref:Uncharacterized protein n=1 Tax=Carnegiea gigantea TaxID=171969 RepID=A0A9Q1GTG0_9CARY|nr:LOW QUALITY PROTEIN: hypothetical protein Cgig2_007860 [Carnegiea gigantea]